MHYSLKTNGNMKKIIFSCLLAILMLGACTDDVFVFDEPVYPEERLGNRTLSWISVYEGKSKVIFENEAGEQTSFSIERSERIFFKSYFKDVNGESFTLLLRNDNTPDQLFTFLPNGNNQFSIGVAEELKPFTNSLLEITYSPFGTSTILYMAQGSIREALLSDYQYEYGSAYPRGFNDRFVAALDPAKNTTFLNRIEMQQGVGIVHYIDQSNAIWRQVSIE